MPISPIVLQRRHAELGRIRLGAKGAKGQPQKLSQFRLTSPSERYIRDLADLYGGTAQPWDNNGKAEWEVYTTATSIPVIVIKGGLSQWLETWSGGGCTHRCDGERNVEGDACDPEDRLHQQAKPTTRLSVMLPELEAIGAFRMESHGWNAAAEIPAVAELAQFVGEMVPAHLNLVERRTVRDGKTSRFVVPVLDLQIGTRRLREIVDAKSNGLTALDAPAPAALGQGEGPRVIEAPTPDYTAELADCETVQCCRDLWARAGDNGHLDDGLRAAIQARVAELTPAADTEPPAAEQTVQGSTTDDEDAAWQDLLTAAGNNNMSQSELESEFVQNMGVAPAAASAAQMRMFTQVLTTGEATQLPEGTDEQPGAVA